MSAQQESLRKLVAKRASLRSCEPEQLSWVAEVFDKRHTCLSGTFCRKHFL